MSENPFRIVIIGGGTAGWMSAAYLEKRLGRSAQVPVSITLVEAKDIDTIGVGEATIPGFLALMSELDIPEYRLFSEADATFKNAIKFVGWGQPDCERGYFYHAFDPPIVENNVSAGVHWLALKSLGLDVQPFDLATSIGSALCEANRSPKTFDSRPYESPVPYAYHLDARKLGILLRSVATSRGVRRVEDKVVGADLSEDGDIVALQLSSGDEIEGDLFIDCSGFKGLLIDQAMNSSFVSYADKLICDRAMVCHSPLEENADPRCYTTATAQPAGWTWDIDLTTRTGTGYVFSSRYHDSDDALDVLRRHLKNPDIEARQIDLKVGFRPEPWKGNCVAIGLSAGFLEPLESTGIYLIDLGLRILADHISTGPIQPELRGRYNLLMKSIYEETSDFLVMHYIFNGRKGEPFWDFYRDEFCIPAPLAHRLSLWRHRFPINTDFSPVSIFEGYSYFTIMSGLGVYPSFMTNSSRYLDFNESASILDRIFDARESAKNLAPSHKDMLQRIRASAGL